MTTDLRPRHLQEHHPRPVGGRRRGLAPLGPAIEDWLGDATDADARRRPPRRGCGCSTSPPAPAGRPSPPPAGSARRDTCSPPTSPRRSSSTPRRTAADAGLANVETLEADGEDLSAVPDGAFDAADLPGRADLLPRPAARADRDLPRRCGPAAGSPSVVYSTPDRNGFFALPVGIIRRIAGLPAPAPGLPGPFSLGAPGVAEAAYERGRTRRRHRHAGRLAGPHGECRRVRARSSGSPSAPCTRCCPA